MARSDVTLNNIAGFVEEVVDNTGTDRLVDYKKVFGPIFEEYMRDNQWMSIMDWAFNDQERVITKLNYTALRATEVDFDPTTKATGATVKPERERVLIEHEKEVAATWYDRDFKLSNGLETVGERISSAIFRIPDSKIDAYIADSFAASVDAATGDLAALELDIDAMEYTAENGEIVLGAIKNQMLKLIKSGAANDYVEGTKIARDMIKIAISIEVEELLTSFKASYIDQSGLLNVGVFGSNFRNVQMKTMTEMPEGKHVIMFTRRAKAGTFIPSIHTKFIPEAINQKNYMNELNHSYGYGMKEVFENEVTGIVQPAEVVPPK